MIAEGQPCDASNMWMTWCPCPCNVVAIPDDFIETNGPVIVIPVLKPTHHYYGFDVLGCDGPVETDKVYVRRHWSEEKFFDQETDRWNRGRRDMFATWAKLRVLTQIAAWYEKKRIAYLGAVSEHVYRLDLQLNRICGEVEK